MDARTRLGWIRCQSAPKRDPRSASKKDPPAAALGRSRRRVDHRHAAARASAAVSAPPEPDAGLGPGALRPGPPQVRVFSRQLAFPVSRMSQWCVSRSSSAVVILASPNTLGHSANGRLVVTITEVRSLSRADRHA